MSVFFEFDEVDTFTAGVVGQPGSRTFYLHARVGTQRVTVKCEKQQVGAIAQHLRKVLADLPPPDDRPLPSSVDLSDAETTSLFVLGPIGLGYDRSNDRLLIQLEELVVSDVDDDEDDDDPVAAGDDIAEDRGHVRLYVTRSQAAAFCDHADEIIAAGRPACRWCGNPIDPDGHPCPRMN